MKRRTAAMGVMLTLFLPQLGLAETYPDRPVRFVVPFPPGGLTDRIARSLAAQLHESLGQPFVVDNKPGAGATIGSEFVARSKADGYTLLMGSHASHAINASLMKLSYDPTSSFEPLSLLATVPNMLLLHPSNPANSLKELIAQAKTKPGGLTYTSAGIGTSGHIAGAMLASMSSVNLLHVPARGAPQAVQDALAGHVDILFDSTSLSMPLVKAGKLKALAITSRERSPALPNLPTMAEAGLPGYEVLLWFALYVPAGTPKAIVNRLHTEVAHALNDPKIRAPLTQDGVDVIASTPEGLARFQRAEIDKYARLVKELDLKTN